VVLCQSDYFAQATVHSTHQKQTQVSASVQAPNDFEDAFGSMKTQGAQAIIVLSDAMFFGNRDKIANLATEKHLPAISYTSEFARSGTIMSHGPDLLVLAQRAAAYVDKILKGAKPADLPVEQPTKFEFIINLKTARTLGVAVPNVLLIAADEVIE
jgi:putative ABC transport system substrate-binding protein